DPLSLFGDRAPSGQGASDRVTRTIDTARSCVLRSGWEEANAETAKVSGHFGLHAISRHRFASCLKYFVHLRTIRAAYFRPAGPPNFVRNSEYLFDYVGCQIESAFFSKNILEPACFIAIA